MPRKKTPVVQVDDGEWVDIAWKGQREECCECGLIHRVDFRIREGGVLQFKATRVPR